ncbi:MAG TPA: redox-regulated ATPase YchF [Planctomycetota bacterium]|nr:redox-regulated ATPase YchF [Planctomycetota bacterium]
MKLGLIGFPACGKTSLFNAVTGSALPVGQYSNTPGIHMATVRVHDPRMYRLKEFYKPKSFVLAHMECADVSGLIDGKGEHKQISAEVMGNVRQVDAIIHVVRAFDSSAVPHVLDSIDPRRDMAETVNEMLFSDMAQCDQRIKKLKPQVAKHSKTQEHDLKELAVLEHRLKHLEAGKPVSAFMTSNEDEKKIVAAFQFLTAKPMLTVFNVGEGDLNPGGKAEQLEKEFPGSIALCAKLEMELSQLSEEERALFLQELGIKEAAAPRLAAMVYKDLGLISFFTVGEDEVRAWTIHKGDHAQQAAGRIHSDLAKNFIRAEVFTYADLDAAGGDERAMKAKHPLRLESKDYVVKDGDILNIRANTR